MVSYMILSIIIREYVVTVFKLWIQGLFNFDGKGLFDVVPFTVIKVSLI